MRPGGENNRAAAGVSAFAGGQDRGSGARIDRSPAASDGIRLDLRTLAGKLESLRREWSETRASDRDLASLEDQMAAMRQSLTGLAPREAIEALEGSLTELAQRVSVLDRGKREESPPFVVDAAVGEGIAQSGHDAESALAQLERRVASLCVRIDALADGVVGPEAIESLRRRMEEVHDLLLTAARRSVPIDRVEGQIANLVRQVERLAANASTGSETEHSMELLAALRGDGATEVVATIERRLEEIPVRLGDEVAAVLARTDIRELESTARRVDEALQQSQIAARRIEASLDALNLKLEGAETEPLAAEIRNLSAKLDAVWSGHHERSQIEPMLAEIVGKLDSRPSDVPEREAGALASVERELKSIRDALENGATAAFDVQAANRLADGVARRLEDRLDTRMTTVAISEQVAQLAGRFDGLAGRLGEAEGLERAARDLLEKLREGDWTRESAHPTAEFAEQLSAFRQERVTAERRTEALLQGVQNVLDTLINRLPAEDRREPPRAPLPDEDDERVSGVRWVSIEPPGNVGAGPPGQAMRLDPERAGPSQESENEFLLEPGAEPPRRLQAGADLSDAVGLRTNSAISAHIAAARRAAQSALAENIDARPSGGWPRVERNVQRARRFYAQHRRSFLIALTLALAVTAAARLMGAHAPLFQRSWMEQPPAKTAATQAVPSAATPAVGAAQDRSVDTAPTGSIGRSQTRPEGAPPSGPTPPELSAALPGGVSPSLRDAVLSGVPAAQYELAQRLFDGRGFSQDQAAAAFWFDQAAAKGFAPAAFRLGAMYQKGVGVQRDLTAAKRWYTAAARSGNARAAHNLGVMDAEPAGERADYAEAAKWFRRAAEMGIRDSQFNLAVLYARGLGVEQDFRHSWMWFSLAAAQGDAEAAKKRDEVAGKMGPDALTAAAEELSKFKVTEPDPAANDVAATGPNRDDKANPGPPSPPSTDGGSRSEP
jgi:localization factor PodJL